MNGDEAGSDRQQNLYWKQMVELKMSAEYMRRRRDELGRKVTALAALKAIASSGGIAGWAIWHEYAFFWGLIIAVSQLADALKDVFPFARAYKGACDLTIILNGMFIDAQLEWENIFAGPVQRRTDPEPKAQTHETAA